MPICPLLPGVGQSRRKSTSFDDSFDDSDFEMHSFHQFKEKIFNQDSSEQALLQNGKHDQMDANNSSHSIFNLPNQGQNVMPWEVQQQLSQTLKGSLEHGPGQLMLQNLMPTCQSSMITNGSSPTTQATESPYFAPMTAAGSPCESNQKEKKNEACLDDTVQCPEDFLSPQRDLKKLESRMGHFNMTFKR